MCCVVVTNCFYREIVYLTIEMYSRILTFHYWIFDSSDNEDDVCLKYFKFSMFGQWANVCFKVL